MTWHRMHTRPFKMRAVLLAAALSVPTWTQSPLRAAIVFVSTRDNPAGTLADAAEIYLMDGDGTNARRLTNNHDGDRHR